VERRPLGREVERDLRVVVRDDEARHGVDDRRDGDAAREGGIRTEVGLAEELDAEDRVAVAIVQPEPPAAVVADRVDHRRGDRVLEAEQPPDDHGPVRPRAGQGHDQAVAARLDGPQAVGVRAFTRSGLRRRRDPAVEAVGLADELAGGCALRHERGFVVMDRR
jgi:hypothetical protein